jgi:hypothetical protein
MRRSSTTRVFVSAAPRLCRHNVGEVLLETQVRFTDEPVRVRINGAKETVYFSLDSLEFVLSFDVRNP